MGARGRGPGAGRQAALLEDLAGRVRDAGDSVLVLNTMPLPRTAAGQLVSYQDRARLARSGARRTPGCCG